MGGGRGGGHHHEGRLTHCLPFPAQLKSVAREADGLRVEVQSRQSDAVVVLRGYSHVLCAVGRAANTQGIGLERTVSD